MPVAKLLTLATVAACAAVPLAADAGTFTTLYTFAGQLDDDSGNPTGPLTYHQGALYGTTPAFVVDDAGTGTVFKVDTTTGAFAILYDFKGGADGYDPVAGVIYHDGMLYGTTYIGGGSGCVIAGQVLGCGTIFSIDLKTGAETVLYSFSQDPNASPAGPGQLLYLAGTLYGTTSAEGANGAGSIFSFNPTTRAFATLHSFTGADGDNPNPILLYQNGLLYGTTVYGGKSCPEFHGCGVVFSFNPTTGAETVLHAFDSLKGGRIPYSNLIYHGHSLMGDTEIGGDKQNFKLGEGVSFSINIKTGHEKVLDTFVTRNQSYSGLSLVGDNVYETIPLGGSSGLGEIDQFNLKTGQQTVLYDFTGGAGGSDPMAPLIYHDGAFYGTTYNGGKVKSCYARAGCGTIFKYVP